MQNWVDITTIDNSTPFSAVRWKESLTFTDDKWFSEVPNLTTDNMSWTDGDTAALGYFGGHRFNADAGYGNAYTCSFHCDTLGIDEGLNLGRYQYALKDAPRKEYYDTTVTIDGTTYYEVDFKLWDGWVDGVTNLYMPYATNPFTPGDIYVLTGGPDIDIDKTSKIFKASGGTETITVNAEDDWTATLSDSWFSLSAVSGESGTTVLTLTVSDYTGTTQQTGTITFACNADSVTFTVKQNPPTSGGYNGFMFGEILADGAYIGDTPLVMAYMGEQLVYQAGEFVGIKMSPKTLKYPKAGGDLTLKIKSSDDWFLWIPEDCYWLTPSIAQGTSGETIITLNASGKDDDEDRSVVITATTDDYVYSATTVVTQVGRDFPSIPFLVNYNAKNYSSTTNSIPNMEGALYEGDLELDVTPRVVGSDYINVSGVSKTVTFTSAADNPFNRYDDDVNNTITIIYKTGEWTQPDTTLLANRGSSYNYMIRADRFHTQNSNFLPMTDSSNPNIMYIRVNTDNSAIRKCVSSGNYVTAASTDWGTASDTIGFFNGGGYGGEYFVGDFYWLYISPKALTDSEIQEVIEYNENM